MKNTTRFMLCLGCGFVIGVVLTSQAFASGFVPVQWQQRVKSGAFEDQRKHTDWIRDLNKNFVADTLDTMDPEAKTSVIVQMNQCLSREEIQERLGTFGNIRRVGSLVPYVVLDDVRVGDLAMLVQDSAVAAVEDDQLVYAHNDIATRVVRARRSNTFSPETFADQTAVNGTGINIAIVDTGVDDAVHAGFAGKFVSGYNAITATAGNPDCDDASIAYVDTGHDGICNTIAAGDDVQLAPVGQGLPDPNAYGFAVLAIIPGANGVIDTTPVGDDSTSLTGCSSAPYLRPGANGICDSTATGDDIQLIPVGQGGEGLPGVLPGANSVVDTSPTGDDAVTPGVWHGTHVAGAALGLGVGPGCRPADDGSVPNDCAGLATGSGLVDVKVLDASGSGWTSDIIDGIEWLWTDGNTRVVNMSLGSATPSDGSSTISMVINALVLRGLCVVVSSGNAGDNCLGDIAASELAITVAAADDQGTVDRDDDEIAPFSTFGPRKDYTGTDVRVGQLKPDLTAPGVQTMSAQGDSTGSYHALSGTSQAAPYVAGAAALLLSYNPNIPPGSLKELLKRSAYETPAHAALGPSYPTVDDTYEVHWGFGLLDLYQGYQNLSAGIADVTFPSCLLGAAGDNCTPGGNCNLSGGQPSWLNTSDILTANPVVQEVFNTITVMVQNRTAATAEDVVVSVGVMPLGVGSSQTPYQVGSITIDIAALATAPVNFDWTPTATDHQCIIATISYGLDQDFCNNQTQRNIFNIPVHSTGTATFQVVNPFNEPATIVLELASTGQSIQGTVSPRQFTLNPMDCPALAEASFTPQPGLPIGTRETFAIFVHAYTASQPQGVVLPGTAFDVVKVAGGIERAYSVGRHGAEGRINLPLNLAGLPTSDPRSTVKEILVVFDVPVRTEDGELTPESVTITSQPTGVVPPYVLSFLEGGSSGKELKIDFLEPLLDQHRYAISFKRFWGAEFDPLLGDTDLEFRVVQGDANGSGAVTATDVSFVRGRMGRPVEYGETTRADVNMTGTITGPDISFVRSRIGHAAP
jgi:subtilisin family serine protease